MPCNLRVFLRKRIANPKIANYVHFPKKRTIRGVNYHTITVMERKNPKTNQTQTGCITINQAMVSHYLTLT